MAQEVAALVRLEILASVGVTNLIHANYRPGLALVLLNGLQSQFEDLGEKDAAEREAEKANPPGPLTSEIGRTYALGLEPS